MELKRLCSNQTLQTAEEREVIMVEQSRMHRWFASLHVALSTFVQLFRYSFTATPARYFTADSLL